MSVLSHRRLYSEAFVALMSLHFPDVSKMRRNVNRLPCPRDNYCDKMKMRISTTTTAAAMGGGQQQQRQFLHALAVWAAVAAAAVAAVSTACK